MNDLLIRDFLFELYQSLSFDQRFNTYNKYIKKLGFEGVSYSLMPKIQAESIYKHEPIFKFSDDFSSDFLEHYVTENLSKNDFTIKNICNNNLNTMDWKEHEVNKLVTQKELEIIQLAREDYKIKNALSIPTMCNNAGIAGSSIISSEKNSLFQKLKQENMSSLVFITHQFHESNFHNGSFPHKFITPFLDRLTPNEIGILCHLVSGQHFQKIEYSIDVASYKVASNALRNLRKNKFNNITKEKLMYLCGLAGIHSDF